MSDKIKALLSASAGPKGQGDEHWHADGVDRLYFGDPRDINVAGQVDVARPTLRKPEADYVRVELWVKPEVAAEIMSLVTGETDALEKRLRYKIRVELRDETCERVKKEAEEEFRKGELQGQIVNPADIARRQELDKLCREQAADEAEEEVQEIPSGDMDQFTDEGEGASEDDDSEPLEASAAE